MDDRSNDLPVLLVRHITEVATTDHSDRSADLLPQHSSLMPRFDHKDPLLPHRAS